MLLMPNKKKVASIIVASLGKKKPDHVQRLGDEAETGSYKTEREEDGESHGLEAAMEDWLKAAERKDAKGMARAFKNALVLCEEHTEEPSETEDY